MSFADLGLSGRGPGGNIGSGNTGQRGEDIFARFDSDIARRFYAYVRPYRATLGAALAVVVAYTLTQVAIPVVVKHAVDAAVGAGRWRLQTVLTAFAALIVLGAVSGFYQERLAATLAQRVIFDLRRGMYAHLQKVSLSFLDRTHVGILMSRLQGDVNALQEFLETSVNALGDLVMLVGIVGVLLVMDWRLGVLTLLVLPALVAIRAVWLPLVKQTFRRARDASSIVNGALAENIGGVRTVQEARREGVNFADFTVKARENFQAQVKAAWAAQIMVPTVDVLTGVALAAVIVVGGASVLAERLSLGAMVAFIFYVQRFFDPIRTLSMQYTTMQRAMAAGHRIFEVLDVPLAVDDAAGAGPLAPAPPSLEFIDVTYGYTPGRPVLHGVSFRVEPTSVVALVGPTGSGKTSITALARRFYDVWEGRVLVAGQDVRRVTSDSLGRTIAMVLQEPFLFTGTVLDNIRFNHVGASFEQVVAAARAVKAHDFILDLPKGYDTMLEQRGQNLSLGQRQLISFARALVADPQILVLDEATASIDSFTEQDIQAALKALMRGRTCLVIAHRLATVRHADKIIVLKDGRVVEEGDHRTLIARGGLYAELTAKNTASFDDADNLKQDRERP